MESCISEFLDGCDADNDHKITLTEWGKCLGADSGKKVATSYKQIRNVTQIFIYVGEMEDKCAQFTAQNDEESA